VGEEEAEGLPVSLALSLGEVVLVLVCELERDTEGEVAADREMEAELEALGLPDCVMETSGELLVLGLPEFVRDTVTETDSVGEALKEPPLGVAEPVGGPVLVTVVVGVAEEDRVAAPLAVLRELTELLKLGEPLPVLLGVKVLELVESGVDVPLGVPLVVAVAALVAVDVPVKLALWVAEREGLVVVEMLGEEDGDREVVSVDAPERLRVAVLELLGEARKVREWVKVGVGDLTAEAERTEAVREAVTQLVGEVAAVRVREGEVAPEGVVLDETEWEGLLKGEREGESKVVTEPVVVTERLASLPVNEGLEESVGETPEEAEALVLPPGRDGVTRLVGVGTCVSVPLPEDVTLRVREGEALWDLETRGLEDTDAEAEGRTEALWVPERRAEAVGAAREGEGEPECEGVAPPVALPMRVEDTDMVVDKDLETVKVLEREPVREVDTVRVAPPPPGAAREGEAVLHCETLGVVDDVTLGQALVVRVTRAEEVGRGVEEREALALLLAEARRVLLVKAEEVEEREGLTLTLPLSVALAGVAETRALPEKEEVPVELLETRAEELAKLLVALGENLGDREGDLEGARLTDRVTETVSVSL
jgi:hypothetical protein